MLIINKKYKMFLPKTFPKSLSQNLLQKAMQPFSKKQQNHLNKFNTDYEYFKGIPLSQRTQQLQRIINLSKQNKQFIRQIPSFPIQQIWNYHGTELMTHTWHPPSKTKVRGVVVFHHALNGHIGNFGQFARSLSSRGFVCTGHDFINFGQSKGERRGCLQSFDDLVSISEQYIIRIKNKYDGVKIFTAGMSLGGAVTFNILLKNPNIVNGAIFLSPSIRQNKLHYPLLKKLTILFSTVFPYRQLLRQTGRNGSKYKLDQYSKKDPYLYHGRLYPKTVRQILLAMGATRRQYSNFTTPYLLIQSGNDKLVDPFACLDLEHLSPSQDKTTVLIYDMWHAIWLDDYAHDVIQIMEEWLEVRI